jgi:hypothetical protein
VTLIKTTDVKLPATDPDDPYRLAWEAMTRNLPQQAAARPIKSAVFGLMYQDRASD